MRLSPLSLLLLPPSRADHADYTYPLTRRREALAQYCFECRCPRCAGGLNVYQVRAAAGLAAPDGLDLVADADADADAHPAAADAARQALARSDGESATRLVEDGATPDALPERHAALRAQYAACRGLVAGDLWAVSPVPRVLAEASIYYAEAGSFASALAVACLVATAADPIRYAAWFHPVRVRNLLVVAKLLANTAEDAGANAGAAMERKVRDRLRDVDQVALCQMLLLMVLKAAPAGCGDEWELAEPAREMLRDIERLPGRDRELSLINAWASDSSSDQSKAFFDYAVVQQVKALADLGRAVVDQSLGAGD